MDVASTSGPQSKRARMDCVIHCTDDDSHLVQVQDMDSWKTLLKAAEIRDHKPLLDVAKDLQEGTLPSVSYHRKCRSIFTMKKLLDAIKAKKTFAEESGFSEQRQSIRQGSQSSRVYEAKCYLL